MAKVSRRALARAVADRLAVDGADGQAVMREVAAYLIAHKMTDDADVVINDIAEEIFNSTGRLVVEVTSAHPLTDEGREKLIDYFKTTANAKTVELYEKVDEDLIGGLIAKTPSAELDISVRNTLRQLTGMVG